MFGNQTQGGGGVEVFFLYIYVVPNIFTISFPRQTCIRGARFLTFWFPINPIHSQGNLWAG